MEKENPKHVNLIKLFAGKNSDKQSITADLMAIDALFVVQLLRYRPNSRPSILSNGGKSLTTSRIKNPIGETAMFNFKDP